MTPAPVYRNIDASSSVLGLALPYEAGAVGLLAVLGVAWAPPLPAALATLGLYLALRVAGRGKPPGHLQDALPFALRRRASGGRYSAVARTRGQPRFPYAPYVFRDGPAAVPSPRAGGRR